MLTYFLFLFYLTIGILLLHRMVRKKDLPFTIYHTTAVVLFKVLMGSLYGYIFLHYYGGDDTWGYFYASKIETDLLLTHPDRFFRELLPGSSLWSDFFHSRTSCLVHLQRLENGFMVKSLAVLNLFSGKNYYVDLLWFDLLTIAGSLLLFKILIRHLPQKAGMYFLLVFFIPSITFWISGIRTEALIVLFIAIVLYNGEEYANRSRIKHAAGILLGLAGFLLFRYQYLFFFLPAFAAFMISLRKKLSTPVYFNRIYLVMLLIFVMSLFLPPALQLSRPLIYAQQSFLDLHGNTRYALDSLRPGPVSFFKILPQAIANSSFRPYPWEGNGLLQSLSSIESIFLFTGFLFFALNFQPKNRNREPLFWLFLYYAVFQLIAIGFTVPFPGAIVRYRSIPFLFLFLFLFSPDNVLHEKLNKILFSKTLHKNII